MLYSERRGFDDAKLPSATLPSAKLTMKSPKEAMNHRPAVVQLVQDSQVKCKQKCAVGSGFLSQLQTNVQLI